MEHPNRGKRSIGLALELPEAMEVLDELIRTSDVFLTNFLPRARRKLGIELEDVRKVNPDIIYVRGSGFGSSGPDATKAATTAPPSGPGAAARRDHPDRVRGPVQMPAGAYGD